MFSFFTQKKKHGLNRKRERDPWGSRAIIPVIPLPFFLFFSFPFTCGMTQQPFSHKHNIIMINGSYSRGWNFGCRPTFVKIWKKGSVEQYSPTPYLATLINCMVWVVYGLPIVHPKSTLVITINGTGTVIEILYIIMFFIYSDKKKRLKVIAVVIVELIFIAVLVVLVLTLLHTTKQRSMVVGIICICFNIMMYASPLSVMVSIFLSYIILQFNY